MSIDYNELKNTAKTGDLLFFRGPEIVSKTIRFCFELELGKNASIYSHVGMILRGSDFPSDHIYYDKDILYIWESTNSWGFLGDGIKNIDGKYFLGVQLRVLDDIINGYDIDTNSTCIAFSKLKKEVEIDPNKISEIFKENNGKRYEINLFNMFTALFPCLRKFRHLYCVTDISTDHLYCSELVAVVYKSLGILDSEVETYNVVPPDFISKNTTETFDSDKEIPPILEYPLKIIKKLE